MKNFSAPLSYDNESLFKGLWGIDTSTPFSRWNAHLFSRTDGLNYYIKNMFKSLS